MEVVIFSDGDFNGLDQGLPPQCRCRFAVSCHCSKHPSLLQMAGRCMPKGAKWGRETVPANQTASSTGIEPGAIKITRVPPDSGSPLFVHLPTSSLLSPTPTPPPLLLSVGVFPIERLLDSLGSAYKTPLRPLIHPSHWDLFLQGSREWRGRHRYDRCSHTRATSSPSSAASHSCSHPAISDRFSTDP